MATRSFSVSGDNITVAASSPLTLVFLNPSAAPSMGVRILRAWIGQTGVTTTAMQRVTIVSQVTAFPTLTAATPRPLQHQDPTAAILTGGTAGAAGTCGINASAEGAGTKTIKISTAFNVVNSPWEWVPTPQEVIEAGAGSASGLGLVLNSTAATTSGWSFGINYQEI